MTTQRTIPFGTGRHLGTLYHREPSTTWGGWSEWWPWDSKQEIDGPAVVPAGAQVRLWASQKEANGWRRVTVQFGGLRDLAPDDLDSLAVLQPGPRWAGDIAHLTDLSELIIEGWHPLADDEFQRLFALEQLVGLDVGYATIPVDRLGDLIGAYQGLRFLNVEGIDLGDAFAEAIARLPLRSLKLGESGLSDDGLLRLANLTALEVLSLEKCPIGNGISALEGMAGLRSLDAARTAVTDDAMVPILQRMRRLERLCLDSTSVGDATIAALTCPTLESLDLNDTQVTGGTLDPELLGELAWLSVNSAPLTKKGMAQIARLPSLKTLFLSDVSIDDSALAQLNGHPTLEHIGLAWSPVSPGAVLDLVESLPMLRSLARGMSHYRAPETIAEYTAQLRTAPVGAKTIAFEDLDPIEGTAETLDGQWADLGRIVDDGWDHPRVFTHDRFGRLWVGCSDDMGVWSGPLPPAWQQPGWWPEGQGPIVLGSVRGALAFEDGMRAWIGNHILWSYDLRGRSKLVRQRPPESGCYADMAFDRSGRTWAIRSYSEVWCTTRRGWENVAIPDFPRNTSMEAIAAHPDGSVWVATGRGLLRWRRGTWTHWHGPADGLPESYAIDAWAPSKATHIRAVVVGTDGAVWASGGTGVVRFRDGDSTCWDHRDGLWPWRHLAIDSTTGDVYGAGHSQIGRFDGSEWAVTEVPPAAAKGYDGGIRHATVRDGRLLVLTGDAHLRQFTPNDLAERRAAAPSGRRTIGQRLRSLRPT